MKFVVDCGYHIFSMDIIFLPEVVESTYVCQMVQTAEEWVTHIWMSANVSSYIKSG